MKKDPITEWLFRVSVLIICIGLLFSLLGTAMAAPEGKASYAASSSQGMRGGDIHTGSGSYHTTLLSMLHGKLMIKDRDGRLQPDLAKSWEVGPAWSWIKFHLNENAKFHDGQPVTAEDVKFSFERAASKPKYVYGGEIRRKVDRVEVVDKHTVIIHNKSPYAALLDRCSAYFGILPKHYIEKVGDEEFAKKTIGAGPFKLVKNVQDVSTDVEAYMDHGRKVPNVKHFRYLNVQEDATRTAMLKTGEIDVAMLSGKTFWEFEGDPNIRVYFSKNTYLASMAFYDLPFPQEKSPFLDIRVRKAASLAINRKMICEKILHGMHTPWGDILAPYNAGFDPNLTPDPYDPEKAKALLKEAGYPNGFETDLVSGPATKLDVEGMAASLATVGIRAKLVVPEAGMWSRMVRERKVRGLGRHPGPWWAGRSHPASALSHFDSKYPWTFHITPELDQALSELEKMTEKGEMTVKARAMSKSYREQYIRAPLWACNVPYGLRKRIKYWEQPAGWIHAVLFEYLELAD